jgi:hypothetical protein
VLLLDVDISSSAFRYFPCCLSFPTRTNHAQSLSST